MKYRELVRLLTEAGFTPRRGKGDHEVWRNGAVSVTITRTREVSPKVTRDALSLSHQESPRTGGDRRGGAGGIGRGVGVVRAGAARDSVF